MKLRIVKLSVALKWYNTIVVRVCVPGISPQTLAQMVLLSVTAQPALPEQQPSEMLYGALPHYHMPPSHTRTLSSHCSYSYSKTLIGSKHNYVVHI